ncbi:unnamed protein product, partial [Trichogramma brassicae]
PSSNKWQDRYHLQCSSKCKYPHLAQSTAIKQQVAASAPPAPHHVQVPPPVQSTAIGSTSGSISTSSTAHQVQAPPMRPI